MNEEMIAIENTIQRLEKLSAREGLDVFVEDDRTNSDLINLVFVKENVDMEHDTSLVPLLTQFTTEVVGNLVLKGSGVNRISVSVEPDDIDEELINIRMVLPKTPYVVESIFTYIALAYKSDPFLTM